MIHSQFSKLNSPEFGNVRMIETDTEDPWFVAEDVTKLLGFPDTKEALKEYVEPQDIVFLSFDDIKLFESTDISRFSKSGETFISEAGFYQLVLCSDHPAAVQFQDWVVKEVLPSVFATGTYISDQENMSEAEYTANLFVILKKIFENNGGN